MWKSEKLLKQEAEIEQLLAALIPIDQFESDMKDAMHNIDVANGFISQYLQHNAITLQ